MASRKAYSYYLRGKQIALIEQDSVLGDGQTLTPPGLNDVGPDGSQLWKSPLTSVTDGLEIEYAYSPRYILPSKNYSSTVANRNFFSYVGWTAVDGYLTFLTGIYQMFSTYSTLAANSHIVIEGSNRWNGLHKVQEVQAMGATSHGGLKTYTKVPEPIRTYYEDEVTWNSTSETITEINSSMNFSNLFMPSLPDDSTAGADSIEDAYPSATQTSFLHLSGSDSSNVNNGMYTNWKMTNATILDLSGATKYQQPSTNDLDIASSAANIFSTDTDNPIYIYEAFLDPGFIYGGVDTLDDESDTIDLPEYLTKALVYYVKAKMVEDQGDMGARDALMKEFYAIIEKHESSKIWGARMIAPGPNAIR